MNEVSINDTVVCKNNSGREMELTVGKEYRVVYTDYRDFLYDGTFLLGVKNDEGDLVDYGGVRFKII